MQTTRSVPAVERALLMLETLDHSIRGMNTADLARKLGIARSTAHTIVLTLERCGYLTRDASQRHCSLTPKAYLLGREAMSYERLASAALAPMRQLCAGVQLTSHLAMLEDSQAIYIQKVESSSLRSLDTYVGKRTNLHCTAVGKILLAYAPESHRLRVLERKAFARYTPNTMTSPKQLTAELARVGTQGYAMDNQEEELNVRCIAVPVLNRRGNLLAALSLSGNTLQVMDTQLSQFAALLKRTAEQISARYARQEIHDVAC